MKILKWQVKTKEDKVLNEFIHIAAHELRNPIQPILSLSQIVKSDDNKRKE